MIAPAAIRPYLPSCRPNQPRAGMVAAIATLNSAMSTCWTFDLDEYVFEALRAGASGFLLKDAAAEELITAIRTVAAGEALIDPGVTRRVIDAFVAAPAPTPIQTRELSRLTERELQVLRLIARGLTNAEIANRLVVSEATAKTHVSNVLTKLGLRDRVQG